jgi:hypothetical protein
MVFDLPLAMTPVPAPTVTETVVVPTAIPTPVITFVPPDNGIDVWKDVVWGNFGGAVLGALVALVIALLVMSSERRARLEERRTTFATQFIEVAAKLHWGVETGDLSSLTAALGDFARWAPRMVGLYGNTMEHRRYAEWLQSEVEPLMPQLGEALAQYEMDGRIDPDLHRDITATLAVLQGSTIKWIMMKPRHWQPDYQIRRQLEADRAQGEAASGDTQREATSDESGIPGTPSPRQSE